MEYMVRFARTPGLAVGFHAIPVGRKGPIESESELGQYRSHGCVRQKVSDAAHLWDWAPIGTTVVVTP
jgi:lipoprotein-anchoring transpeptidase ErfK/SrfK